MLNPLIDRENTNINNEKNNKNTSTDTSFDCSWCIFCDFEYLFICCLE